MIYLLKLTIGFFNYFFIPSNKKEIIVFIEKKNDIIYFEKFFTDLFNIKKRKIIIIYSEDYFNLG